MKEKKSLLKKKKKSHRRVDEWMYCKHFFP